MLDGSAMRVGSSDMTKPRKPHPIVQVVQDTASELNDLLNAVGLRIALLRHELEATTAEAEMVRLAGLIDKAAQRVRRLEDYTRAEELVAVMRRGRTKRKIESADAGSSAFLSESSSQTALLISNSSADDSALKECLERSGCEVVVAESSADGLRLLQSNASFDHIVCDSAFMAESGWKFTAEISRAAPSSRVYILHRHSATGGPSGH
jgi:PleD family two-component response regulator